AARHISKRKIENADLVELSCIHQPAVDLPSIGSEPLTHLRKTPRAGFASHNARLRIASCKDEGFATRRCACIEDAFDSWAETLTGAGGNLSDELRPLILNARATFAKCRGRCDIAGDDDASAGQQIARFELNAITRKLGLDCRALKTHRHHSLCLSVLADRACCVLAVVRTPSLNQPCRMGLRDRLLKIGV